MKSFFLNSHASSKIFLSIKPVSLVIDRFHLSTRLSAGKEESLNRWRLRFPLYLVASEEKKNVKIKDSNIIYIFHLTRYVTSEKIDQKMQNFKIAVQNPRKTRTWNIRNRFFDWKVSSIESICHIRRYSAGAYFHRRARFRSGLISNVWHDIVLFHFRKRYSIQKQSVREIGSESGRTHGRANRRWNELLVRRPGRPPCNSLLINRLISNLGIRRISALPSSLPTCFVSYNRDASLIAITS